MEETRDGLNINQSLGQVDWWAKSLEDLVPLWSFIFANLKSPSPPPPLNGFLDIWNKFKNISLVISYRKEIICMLMKNQPHSRSFLPFSSSPHHLMNIFSKTLKDASSRFICKCRKKATWLLYEQKKPYLNCPSGLGSCSWRCLQSFSTHNQQITHSAACGQLFHLLFMIILHISYSSHFFNFDLMSLLLFKLLMNTWWPHLYQ